MAGLLKELIKLKFKPVKLLVDNKSAIELANNLTFHSRSKHINVCFHYIRSCVEDFKVEIEHVATEDQQVDILTKSLRRIKLTECMRSLGYVMSEFISRLVEVNVGDNHGEK